MLWSVVEVVPDAEIRTAAVSGDVEVVKGLWRGAR